MSDLEDTAYNYGAEVGTRKPHHITELEAENDRLRGALTEAVDLLLERTYGSPARSPGHNARLVLQAALKAGAAE